MTIDNSDKRLLDVFFYGLYMDAALLSEKKVEARNPRIAVAPGYRLRLGKMATLLRAPGHLSIGMLYSLTHAELNRLYWGAGLDAYVAEALTVHLLGRTSSASNILTEWRAGFPGDNFTGLDSCAALCCNLLIPPADDESNPVYQEKLVNLMHNLQMPLPDELVSQ